jgi:hypothetical protein
MKLKFYFVFTMLFNYFLLNDNCNFNQLFIKMTINKKFKFVSTMKNKNYFTVNMKDCFDNFEIKVKGSCLYFIKSKFNSIVIDEYVFENESSANSFYIKTNTYSSLIRSTDEGKIRDVCTNEQLRWDRFIYAVQKNNHVYLFGYQNETKYPTKSLQYNIDKDKNILIDDLVKNFEALK